MDCNAHLQGYQVTGRLVQQQSLLAAKGTNGTMCIQYSNNLL